MEKPLFVTTGLSWTQFLAAMIRLIDHVEEDQDHPLMIDHHAAVSEHEVEIAGIDAGGSWQKKKSHLFTVILLLWTFDHFPERECPRYIS